MFVVHFTEVSLAMKRILALVFLFLYFYNIVGYLALFSVMQSQVRSEVKKMLKSSVPEKELITLAFSTKSLEMGDIGLHWMDDHEFRFDGSMYDILHSYTSAETTYYVCINDVQEELLFEHLDNHVHKHMGDSGEPGKFDSFKDVFKDSLARFYVPTEVSSFVGLIILQGPNPCLPVHPDVPFHPPRFIS